MPGRLRAWAWGVRVLCVKARPSRGQSPRPPLGSFHARASRHALAACSTSPLARQPPTSLASRGQAAGRSALSQMASARLGRRDRLSAAGSSRMCLSWSPVPWSPAVTRWVTTADVPLRASSLPVVEPHWASVRAFNRHSIGLSDSSTPGFGAGAQAGDFNTDRSTHGASSAPRLWAAGDPGMALNPHAYRNPGDFGLACTILDR